MTDPLPACVLVKGDDPSLVGQALHQAVRELAGGHDLAEVAEEHGGPDAEDLDVARVLDALTTPPFLADRRIVVLRDAGRISSGDAGRLVTWLDDPVPGVTLVLGAGGGTIPAVLTKAAERSGRVVNSAPGTGRARSEWLVEHLAAAPVKLDARAGRLIGEHLGGDMSRLAGILDTLVGAYGEGARLGEAEVAPFLGQAGSVAPWDLTDAIDAGDTPLALDSLTRLCSAGGFHPLAVLSILHRHYQAMLRLDGSGATTAGEAAEILGARSSFVAKKALDQGRRLGYGGISRAIGLLHRADVDLRGASALDAQLVMEILVARLSRLAPRQARQRSGRSSPSRSHRPARGSTAQR